MLPGRTESLHLARRHDSDQYLETTGQHLDVVAQLDFGTAPAYGGTQ